MKNKIFWDVREVELESLRVGKIDMFLAYSVFDDKSSEVEVKAIDEMGDIYGAEIVVQDRYSYDAHKKACFLFTERAATEKERRDYKSHFVLSFAGGFYRDGARGEIQDALDALHVAFLKSK